MIQAVLHKSSLVLICFILAGSGLYSQNEKLADSLENIYKNGLYPPENKLFILNKLVKNLADPKKAIVYSEELLSLAEEQDSLNYVFSALLNQGHSYRSIGNFSQALEFHFKAAGIAVKLNSTSDLGKANVAIADDYSMAANSKNAIHYYKKAIVLFEDLRDSLSLGVALSNIGDAYLKIRKPDSSLVHLVRSGEIFKALKYELGIGHNYANIGLAYAQKGYPFAAEQNLSKAIKIFEDYGDYNAICICLNTLSDIFEEMGDHKNALYYANRSLELAKKYGLKNEVSDANLRLSKLYEKDGKPALAFEHFKNYLLYRDSVQDIDRVREMANLRTEYEIANKQVQVDLMAKKAQIEELKKKRQQYISLTSALVIALLAILTIGLYRRFRHIKKLDLLIKAEQIKSENLLLNILPRETAIELKSKGAVKAKKFSSVTVMFADFVSFTKHSEHLSPEDLVQNVGFYFSRFDEIMDKYDLEKIKTIGDCYMCAGGLPFVSQDHASKMILASFEILEFMDSEKRNKNEFCWELRIGINSGPVVAGVVGYKKFAYDIWGDTVNIAARMQTASDPGKINISENTYQLIHHQFDCSYRGEIDVKNKGMLKMYFVNGIKKRTVPNGKGKIIELQSI